MGDKVLILLPNKMNKLQMTWRGPYIVTDKLNECDYKVLVDQKEKTYHANILKKYVSRVDQPDTHIVATIRPEKGKVQQIQEAKPPRTKKELRAFLGLAGYYRKFVPNFATIALPLTDRTKKGQPEQVIWDEECDSAFKTLKRKLCEEPIMCIPDMALPYVLRTDASDRGVGAVLMQDQGQGLQPIAYASKKLSGAENNYATIEKECLAVVWGIKKFQPYLFGTSFVIETDHQPLQYLRKAKTENGRLMRWAIQLQQYDFTVKVIPGKDNVGADYLSRCV